MSGLKILSSSVWLLILALQATGIDASHAQMAPPAVDVAKPLQRTIDRWDEYTGRFEAVQQVEVRPRVSGFLTSIAFKDGELVRAGELLFTIDPRPYEISVESAQAEIAKAKAQVAQAATDVSRAQQLIGSQAITQRDVDARKATLDVAEGQLLAAQASLRAAQLNLEWTRVTAPISGRISDRKVDVGNLVDSASSVLTRIVALDPIHFVFEASESDYLRYSRLAAERKRASSRDAPTAVDVRLADEAEWTWHGSMNFVDNQLGARTGTIRGRAVFANPNLFLIPGEFGRARLFGGKADVLLIPDAAVLSDQASKIVLVVGAGAKLGAKPVRLGPIALGLRSVFEGLSPDDVVVVGGLANPAVRPGAVVTPHNTEIVARSDR
uniref:efflux RND transporter periplasmic adaptor subunit n=1 Tax=Bradyrhizobium sp. (strain ORS 278) TaxID=114615 RepID=UPI0012FEB4EA|nr:efflux RND transporter periplasmic adaptor subunit [Bradyrhizobium sp. ORS 278]